MGTGILPHTFPKSQPIRRKTFLDFVRQSNP
uniref:Uncharacterized protein n=1 Tax=Podoviridae sp. ct9P15 TaxID=2826543 RepID=A0A8S5MFZ0_9CAUD|nr:MAG TPA: hypothetical protein [Podoviridae sp. ct9P15]